MTEQGTRALAAASSLRDALDRTAAALANPQLDMLLAGEGDIDAALASMPAVDDLPAVASLPADEQLVVRRELERARRSLLRCRRLGTSLRDYIRLSFEAQGRGEEYGPRQSAPLTYAGQALNARV